MRRSRSRLAAAVALAGAVGLAAPLSARAATTPPPSSFVINFIPPRVGPISVDIGKVIIGGQVVSPGVHVRTPGTSVPAMTASPPSSASS